MRLGLRLEQRSDVRRCGSELTRWGRRRTHGSSSLTPAPHPALSPPLPTLRAPRRPAARRLVDTLSRSVRQTSDDLAAAVGEIRQLRANNAALVAQLAGAGGAGGEGRPLEEALAAVSKGMGGCGPGRYGTA